jgi:hypothetical protein
LSIVDSRGLYCVSIGDREVASAITKSICHCKQTKLKQLYILSTGEAKGKP